MTVSCPTWKISESNLIKGDLVFTPSSETTEDIGLSALVNENLENTVFSYHVIRFRFLKSFNHKFKKYWCNNTFIWQQFSSFAKGTTRQILDRNDFKNTQVVIPPVDEQKKIADFLDRETAKIDEMVKKTELQIEKLQEYRQALITSAVTGKIMVN
jgi:type I restriction enzyme S subunit